MNISGMVNEWETVAVPLMQGIDVNTRARLVDPQKLLSAKNAFFPRGGGPEKRTGYTGYLVSEGSELGAPPEDFLYGWGLFDSDSPASMSVGGRSDYYIAGPIKGVGHRDNEEVAWDGFRLYSKNQFGFSEAITAYMPTANTVPIAKTENSHAYSDAADNGIIRVVAFRNLEAGNLVVKAYDSVTGSLKLTFTSPNDDPEYIKAVPVGNFVHVYSSHAGGNGIFLDVVHPSLGYYYNTTLGVNVGFKFDIAKVNESLVLLAYIDISDDIKIIYLNDSGSVSSTVASANTQLNIGGQNAIDVSIDCHPLSDEIGLMWRTSTPATRARTFTKSGAVVSQILTLSTDANAAKIGVCASYLMQNGFGVFYGFSDNTLSTNRFVRTRAFYTTLNGEGEGGGIGGMSSSNVSYRVNLVSKPFRVGNVPFVFVCYPSTYQTTYLIYDWDLKPVGKLEYGTAVNNTADQWCFSVNSVTADNPWETYDFHCALMYKQRVLEQDGVFHEISTKFCKLNFMPEFRRAVAGRSLYVPGAQLHQYDGENLYEAGFHITPELSASNLVQATTVGASMANGTYSYRIYPVYKNSQGEEVRGPAITTPDVTVSGANNSVEISIPSVPTRRDFSYFLVYRRTATGTVYYLVSDRDPASSNCPNNYPTVFSLTFVDTLADSDITSRELDPANAAGYLLDYSAPSCEVIGFGKNRLWVAGGEITSGAVLPSKLFLENESPSFNANLQINVESKVDPVTALGFVSDFCVVFKETSGYILSGDPADNTSLGDTITSQLLLADAGCVSHNSVVRLTDGLLFQSSGGIKLVGPGGGVSYVGAEVASITSYITDAVLDTDNRLVKFFQSSQDSLVFDYESGQWTTWTVRPVSASRNIITKNNKLLVESDSYTDDGANYLFSIRSANIGPTLGGFHRVRRVGAVGESDQNYTITVRTYLDENRDYSEQWDWNSSTDLNNSTWGSGTWGSGFWGDSSGTDLYARDSVWRWRHRCAKQKCSCISVEIEYNGPDKGPVHTALIFELGRKSGLDRRMK